MSIQSMHHTELPHKPMPELVTRYRIAHADAMRSYWNGVSVSGWGVKADARIFTEHERQVKALPEYGVWEVVALPPITPFVVELRTTIAVGSVIWALIKAHYSLTGRDEPAKLADVHHTERRKFEDAALIAVLSMNRDAALFAERSATSAAFDLFESFCRDNGLDWLDNTNVINEDDALEVLIARIASKAVQRYRQVLTGTYPGLSQYLSKLEQGRSGVER